MKENVEKLNNQAIILASDGAYKEAIACFIRAITIERDNYLLWYNLGVTYRDAGKISEAKAALVQANSIAPEETETFEALALLCFSLGELEEAKEYCFEGLIYDSSNYRLWNTAGVVFFNQAEYESACGAFERALIINPYYYNAVFNLKDTYKELGNKTGFDECVNKLKEFKDMGVCE